MNKSDNINKTTLKLFWQQIRHHKLSFFLALIIMPLSAVFLNTLLPLFLANAVGDITDSQSFNQNLILAIIFGGLGSLFNYIAFQALIYQEGGVKERLTKHNFKQIINKDVAFFTNQKLGALTSRFIDFSNSQTQIQDLIIMKTSGLVLSFVSSLIILSFRSWQIALAFLIFTILMLVEIFWSINPSRV